MTGKHVVKTEHVPEILAVMATAGTHDTKDLMPEVGNLRVVINEPAPAHVEAIQVNAFGFGGQNASMVVSKE